MISRRGVLGHLYLLAELFLEETDVAKCHKARAEVAEDDCRGDINEIESAV